MYAVNVVGYVWIGYILTSMLWEVEYDLICARTLKLKYVNMTLVGNDKYIYVDSSIKYGVPLHNCGCTTEKKIVLVSFLMIS